jgi:hypothetical protein
LVDIVVAMEFGCEPPIFEGVCLLDHLGETWGVSGKGAKKPAGGCFHFLVEVEDRGCKEGDDLRVLVLDEPSENNHFARVSGHALDPSCWGFIPVPNGNGGCIDLPMVVFISLRRVVVMLCLLGDLAFQLCDAFFEFLDFGSIFVVLPFLCQNTLSFCHIELKVLDSGLVMLVPGLDGLCHRPGFAQLTKPCMYQF